MAGAGYKLFNTGDVLTAAQVNTYLNEQTVMVFADSAARTTALSGVLAEGMMSYLQDTNAVEVYNGSSWVNVGNAGDITEVQAGVGISIASGTGPIPVITNSSTDLITTAGDLLYGTAADTVARLGIGTANQVLQVNSGATAPEWATPAAGGGGFVLITSNTFSNVASVTLDDCFNSTYDTYLVTFVDCFGGTAADDAQIQWRYSTTTLTTDYYSSYMYYTTSAVGSRFQNQAQATISDYIGSSLHKSQGQMFVSNAGSSGQIQARGQWANYNTETSSVFGITHGTTQTYTGLVFKSSSSNVSGTIRVYGLVKS